MERAVALGRDPAALAALRRALAERRAHGGLFDMDGFARDFAATLRTRTDGEARAPVRAAGARPTLGP